MKILAFDTCNAILSTAIMVNDNIIFDEIEYEHSKQAEKLLGLIDKSFYSANIKLDQIDYIAVSVGPGSFTGVRIGLSVALGLNIALNKPIIAISCLEALAYKYTDIYSRILVAMDARREKFYIQNFNYYQPLDAPRLLSYEEIYDNISSISEKKFIIVGEGVKYFQDNLLSFKPKIQTFSPIIDAKMVAKAAYLKIQCKLKMNEVAPLYIREADAKKL